jgi:hypothetical protein
VVKAVGKHYAQCIQAETLRVGTSVTADDLIEAMYETFRIAGGCDEDDSDEDAGVHGNETALVTGSVRYNCYNYGKNGHKAHKCPEKKASGPFSGKCEECAKPGHKKAGLLGE